MNVLEVLTAATGFLKDHGVESPRLNAEHLLGHVLGVKRLELYLQFDRPLGELERAPLRELARRRAEGEPLQHLLGEWDFCGRTFKVDARGLCPRPETEQLVETALRLLPDGPVAAADVGTGSGIIAISLALERPQWRVTATDTSRDALALAAENAACHGLDGRVGFVEADLLPPEGGPFRLITSNPPYVSTAEMERLPREVRRDPPGSLDGGKDGLDVIRRLVRAAPRALAPGGWILLEHGRDQRDAVRSLLEEAGFADIEMTNDLQDLPRLAAAVWRGHG